MSPEYLKATFGLEGHTALITGAGSGLGYAIACSLGKAGARVVVNDLTLTLCDEAVAALRDQGIDAHPAGFDVSDAAAVHEAVEQLARNEWAVDILVSNA